MKVVVTSRGGHIPWQPLFSLVNKNSPLCFWDGDSLCSPGWAQICNSPAISPENWEYEQKYGLQKIKTGPHKTFPLQLPPPSFFSLTVLF